MAERTTNGVRHGLFHCRPYTLELNNYLLGEMIARDRPLLSVHRGYWEVAEKEVTS